MIKLILLVLFAISTFSASSQASPSCPVSLATGLYVGNNSNGTAEDLGVDCRVISWGTNGGGALAPITVADSYCPLQRGSDSCYRIIQCRGVGHDFCQKTAYIGDNFTNLVSSANTPLVCPSGYTYKTDPSGAKADTCVKLTNQLIKTSVK